MRKKKLLFSFLTLILQGSVFCGQGGLFSVVVSVHETAQNAWEAREKALRSVAAIGVTLLARKLCFSKDQERCIAALQEDSECLVESMQIKEQVFFKNAFKAQVLCHFNSQKVKQVFSRQKIPFTIKESENVLLIIDVSRSVLSQEDLHKAWARMSAHFLQFHTGFEGLQEKVLWKNYLSTQNAEPVIAYYANESPKHTLVWVNYRTNECGHHSAHFFLAKKGSLDFVCECTAEDGQDLTDFVKTQAEMLSDWRKAQSYVKPWEAFITLKCKDFQEQKEWFDFKKNIEKTFSVNKQAIFSLSKNKGCVAVEVLQPHNDDISDQTSFA